MGRPLANVPATPVRPQPEYVARRPGEPAAVHDPWAQERPRRPDPVWKVHIGVALAGALVVPVFLGLGFANVDQPAPDTTGATFAYAAVALFGATIVLWPLFQGRLRPATWIGAIAGAPLAFWLIDRAMTYTSDRVCHTHRHFVFWSTECTATPGGGPELAATASLVFLLTPIAIGIAALAAGTRGAGAAAAFCSGLVGAGYGVAGLVLLVMVPANAATAQESNAVQETYSTPGLEWLAVAILLVSLASLLRRRP